MHEEPCIVRLVVLLLVMSSKYVCPALQPCRVPCTLLTLDVGCIFVLPSCSPNWMGVYVGSDQVSVALFAITSEHRMLHWLVSRLGSVLCSGQLQLWTWDVMLVVWVGAAWRLCCYCGCAGV